MADYRKANPNGGDWKKESDLVDKLRKAAENYVVLKRGTRWKEDPTWTPLTPVGQKRYAAAVSIINSCREALGMDTFTVDNNNVIRQELKFDEACIANGVTDLNQPGQAYDFKRMKEGFLKGEEVFDQDKLDTDGLKPDSMYKNQVEIIATLNKGIPEEEDFRDVKKTVAENVCNIITKLNLPKGEKLSEDEFDTRSLRIRQSAPFANMLSKVKTWEDLVKFGLKAVKGKGEEAALAFERENRKLMDVPASMRKEGKQPEFTHFKKQSELVAKTEAKAKETGKVNMISK